MTADQKSDDLIEGLVSRIGQPRPWCCCQSRDRFRCISLRYPRDPYYDHYRGSAEQCQCACHDELEEDEEW